MARREIAPSASSVTLTMNARMFISTWFSRSPTAPRTMSTLASTASAVIVEIASGPTAPAVSVALMPMMSAWRAA
ncbi:MAG: hypothetical protein EBQ75_06340 [Actinobacteria bacterium]|nr:hypothetical protein [Actinomycetota bacterium]